MEGRGREQARQEDSKTARQHSFPFWSHVLVMCLLGLRGELCVCVCQVYFYASVCECFAVCVCRCVSMCVFVPASSSSSARLYLTPVFYLYLSLSFPLFLFPFGLALVVNCSYYNLFYLCLFSLQQQQQQEELARGDMSKVASALPDLKLHLH